MSIAPRTILKPDFAFGTSVTGVNIAANSAACRILGRGLFQAASHENVNWRG